MSTRPSLLAPKVGADSRPWERGRPARKAALARVTLTLALSHKGRGDLSLAIHA